MGEGAATSGCTSLKDPEPEAPPEKGLPWNDPDVWRPPWKGPLTNWNDPDVGTPCKDPPWQDPLTGMKPWNEAHGGAKLGAAHGAVTPVTGP